MKLANLKGRLVALRDEVAVDVAAASGGAYSPDPQSVYDDWAGFLRWAADGLGAADGVPYTQEELGAPVPAPRQVFAIGLNYHDHAAESNIEIPRSPLVFTKFVSSLTGPTGTVTLPPGSVDWEAEIVAVVGRTGNAVSRDDAWDHLAGLMLGQDISERELQSAGTPPQFSLGKSFAGFAPIGPFLATLDEFGRPEDIGFGCTLNGEKMQDGRTSGMVFDIPDLVAALSAVVTLLPGDLIFTGTSSGVGVSRTPQRFLAPGDELLTWADGLGQMRHVFA
ncbi:MAG: fumarylacetoacetate hydrolase [Pseudonocardia sp. SCN 72-86]|nr:MAG: fumarylacetoacetate hydrolase [Pseudonocardia sp. SCN 72-86]